MQPDGSLMPTIGPSRRSFSTTTVTTTLGCTSTTRSSIACKSSDGEWRTPDGRALYAYSGAAGAIGERTMEEHLTVHQANAMAWRSWSDLVRTALAEEAERGEVEH